MATLKTTEDGIDIWTGSSYPGGMLKKSVLLVGRTAKRPLKALKGFHRAVFGIPSTPDQRKQLFNSLIFVNLGSNGRADACSHICETAEPDVIISFGIAPDKLGLYGLDINDSLRSFGMFTYQPHWCFDVHARYLGLLVPPLEAPELTSYDEPLPRGIITVPGFDLPVVREFWHEVFFRCGLVPTLDD